MIWEDAAAQEIQDLTLRLLLVLLFSADGWDDSPAFDVGALQALASFTECEKLKLK